MRGITAICLFTLVALSPTSRAEEARFSEEMWIAVRGALLTCPAWKNRILDIARVPADGNVDLLDLLVVDVRGRTPSEVRSLLGEEFERKTGKPMPEIRIEHIPSIAMWDSVWEALESFRAMIHKSCPISPPPTVVPIPEDRWTPEDLIRIREKAYAQGRPRAG